MKLTSLIQEFDGLEPEESLELLIELGAELPLISPERMNTQLPPSCRVQECQTPVYLWVDVVDGHVHLEADVPEKSPTVRGLVSLIVQGLEGGTAAEIASVPDDLLTHLGLESTLGMTRRQGVRGVIHRIKREVAKTLARNSE